MEEVIAVCARWDDKAGQWDMYTPRHESETGSAPECVTVERRGQALQDLGVTAYSFDGESLKIQGVQSLTDLSDSRAGFGNRAKTRQRRSVDPRRRILQQHRTRRSGGGPAYGRRLCAAAERHRLGVLRHRPG